MEDLNDKITGGTLTAAEWNQVPSEIQNVIEGLGITLSSGDVNQLGKAIAGYAANGAFYTDSGAANAYVLSVIGSKQAPTAYTNGMLIRFVVGNTNTGASTVNVAGLGVKNIKTPTGADPAGGAMQGTFVAEAFYNSAAGYFVLTSGNATETFRGNIELATNTEVQTGTDTVRAVTAAGLASFAKTFSADGYQKFPGGFIVQWGNSGSVTAGGNTTINFSIAFPTAHLRTVITAETSSDSTTPLSGAWQAGTTSSFTLRNRSTVSAVFTWIAIGH